jgi:hypothetical protein
MTEFVFTSSSDVAASEEDLRSLKRWLDSQEQLEADVTLRVRPPGPGEMGGQPDAVVVAALSAVPVARAFFSWLKERARHGRVDMTLYDKYRGTQVIIKAGSSQDVAKLFPAIKEFFNEPQE